LSCWKLLNDLVAQSVISKYSKIMSG